MSKAFGIQSSIINQMMYIKKLLISMMYIKKVIDLIDSRIFNILYITVQQKPLVHIRPDTSMSLSQRIHLDKFMCQKKGNRGRGRKMKGITAFYDCQDLRISISFSISLEEKTKQPQHCYYPCWLLSKYVCLVTTKPLVTVHLMRGDQQQLLMLRT